MENLESDVIFPLLPNNSFTPYIFINNSCVKKIIATLTKSTKIEFDKLRASKQASE